MTMFAKKGVSPMINTARDELRDALAQRETAESALESARQASARGRALIETITRQVEDIEAASVRAASSMAAEMRAAIAGGDTPSVAPNDREKAKNDAARTALDARRQAAEQVVADFKAEEREREREVASLVTYRFDLSLCAKSGHSSTTLRTRQIDPCRTAQRKSRRRRLINSNMTMLHQAAINAGFDFRR
jgi:hypothetical protein